LKGEDLFLLPTNLQVQPFDLGAEESKVIAHSNHLGRRQIS
jgi:hypothetical protein